MASIVSDGPSDFAQLLVDANAEALSGAAVNCLLAATSSRSIDLGERRREGMFFSDVDFAREVARLLHSKMPVNGKVLRPGVRDGGLVTRSTPERLPIEATLEATLMLGGGRLAGIEKRADLAAVARARQVALARFRGRFVDPIAQHRPLLTDWGTGQASNAAALCLDMLVAARAPSVPIAAVLPEVLRCGTRYAQFRARLVDAGLAGRFTSRGLFDAWTDVDVFTTLLESVASDLGNRHRPSARQ